ncbi:sugar phosphate isomerase/epimerase family protein [Streptomyces collinus]|uniref:sugar phosphate isomerase/epimerase family protein n=1 Tax=Streptomyces collinus TaxID=42684 RepID=UPI0036C82678
MASVSDYRRILGGIGDEAAADLPTQIAVHRDLGWRNLELRTVDGRALADLSIRRLIDIADAVLNSELAVPCIDSRIGSWQCPITATFEHDMAELTTLSELAAELGTPYLRVMSYPNDKLSPAAWHKEVFRRFRILTSAAEDRNITLLLENCSGWAGTSAWRAQQLLDDIDSPHLKLLFDIGNPVAHGYDGYQYLTGLVGHVRHVHLKDALPAREDKPVVFTQPGQGAARLEECLSLLLSNGYRGAMSVEPHISFVPHEGRTRDAGYLRSSYIAYCQRLEVMMSHLPLASPAAREQR